MSSLVSIELHQDQLSGGGNWVKVLLREDNDRVLPQVPFSLLLKHVMYQAWEGRGNRKCMRR